MGFQAVIVAEVVERRYNFEGRASTVLLQLTTWPQSRTQPASPLSSLAWTLQHTRRARQVPC